MKQKIIPGTLFLGRKVAGGGTAKNSAELVMNNGPGTIAEQ